MSIVVFARNPIAGQVKTRLLAVLSPEGAARLYEAFLRDTCCGIAEVSVRARVPVYLACSPSCRADFFEDLAGTFGFERFDQAAGDLGVRMAEASRFALGIHEKVVLVGSDTPDLPFERLIDAFESLTRTEVVFGPSRDGGYYCLGMNRLIEPLFQDIQWSTPGVLSQSRLRLEAAGVGYSLLDPWEDVDDPASLERLRERLRQDPQAAPHTRERLARLSPSRDSETSKSR